MVGMVKMAFLDEKFAQRVMAGQFDLMNPEGVIISPLIWSRVVVQGSVVRMRLLETPASIESGTQIPRKNQTVCKNNFH